MSGDSSLEEEYEKQKARVIAEENARMKAMLKKSWLIWAFDPCCEGGWQLVHGCDTREEALDMAKEHDERSEENYQAMVEHCKARHEEPWERHNGCYQACVVTPGAIWKVWHD